MRSSLPRLPNSETPAAIAVMCRPWGPSTVRMVFSPLALTTAIRTPASASWSIIWPAPGNRLIWSTSAAMRVRT